jgi:hypothetical protein
VKRNLSTLLEVCAAVQELPFGVNHVTYETGTHSDCRPSPTVDDPVASRNPPNLSTGGHDRVLLAKPYDFGL